jgi:hypothetical protein
MEPRHSEHRYARVMVVGRVAATLAVARTVALVGALLVASAGALVASPHAKAAEVPRFSAMSAGGPIAGWSPLRPAPNAPDTRYALVVDDGTVVLRADADRSMSGLVHAVRVSPTAFPLLRWRWKVEAPVAGADMGSKAGDDYAARVYVLFDYPPSKLTLGARAKLRLGEALYGQPLPTAALNYVWDNRQPPGTIRPNAYTDRARMVVLRSGSARAGEWVVETRDLVADFRAAFGEDPPDVTAIAVATDTDNTGGRATAWYGDFEFLPRQATDRR